MQKRHDDALTQRIEAVVYKGIAQIEWWELNLWYDARRIGKTVWRDLRERFDEASDKKEAELWMYETLEGVTLIHSDGLKTVAHKLGEEE